MRIAIGSDHRGVDSRLRLVGLLERLGNTVVDCGSHGGNPVDYPDVAADVAERVASGGVDRGSDHDDDDGATRRGGRGKRAGGGRRGAEGDRGGDDDDDDDL